MHLFLFDNNPNKVTYILLMNLVLALGSILYIYITREKHKIISRMN